jgi:hypothetical protein
MADRLGKSRAPVDRMFDGTRPVEFFSKRLEVARCCPSHCAAPAGESLSGLILFVFNSHAHAIFQRVSIGHASVGVFTGLANIRKLISRAKFELPGAALLE